MFHENIKDVSDDMSEDWIGDNTVTPSKRKENEKLNQNAILEARSDSPVLLSKLPRVGRTLRGRSKLVPE